MKRLPPAGRRLARSGPTKSPPDEETALELLLPAMIGGPVGAAVVYLLARRDLGHLRAALAAAATAVALALGWLFALYGAVLGVLAAIVVYAVARAARIGTGRALLAAGGLYTVIVAAVGAAIYASLEYM